MPWILKAFIGQLTHSPCISRQSLQRNAPSDPLISKNKSGPNYYTKFTDGIQVGTVFFKNTSINIYKLDK